MMANGTELEKALQRAEWAERELMRRDHEAIQKEIAEREVADKLATETARAEVHKAQQQELERRRHSAWTNGRCAEAQAQGNEAFQEFLLATLSGPVPTDGSWPVGWAPALDIVLPDDDQSYRGKLIGQLLFERGIEL